MIGFIFSLIRTFTSHAYAHVGYVVGQTEFTEHLGGDSQYLLSPLVDSRNIMLIVLTLIGIFVLYFLAYRVQAIRSWIIAMRARLDTYQEYLPWILRLSLGIALVGASVAGVVLSPLMPLSGFETIELIAGFCLLAGFLVVPSAIVVLGVYVWAVAYNSYLFGNMEMFMAAVALLVLGTARPGADDVIGIKQLHLPALAKYVPVILRIGIGGAMTFLALYEKILNPHVSELVVDQYHLTSIIGVSAAMWVFAVGIIELIVGLFLLIGFQTRLISVIAFLVLATTFFFFKEDVYSHITLFGVLSALMITGAGPWSLDSFLKRRSV